MNYRLFFQSLSIVAFSMLALCLPSNAQIQTQPPLAKTDLQTMQLCGTTADVNIVIMLDVTGSINSVDLANEKTGAKTLLDFFSTASVKPRVAIGTFNVKSSDRARILPGGSLTTTYGADGSPGTGLYSVINNLSATSGNTDIGAAISVGQAQLSAGPQKPNYLVVITDGIPNRYTGDNNQSCGGGNCCGYNQAYDAAINSSIAAKSVGTKIFTLHYGTGDGCPGETAKGGLFLKNNIASDSTYYYEGNASLAGVFAQVSQAIVCDDQNTCTLDVCNPDTHRCQYMPSGPDSDGDGTPDCSDLCPNDPLKTAPGSCGCGVADTDSDHDGILDCRDLCPLDPHKSSPGQCGCGIADNVDICGVCGGNGKSCLGCDGKPNSGKVFDQCGVCGGNGASCLGCNNTDITSTIITLDGNALGQKNLILQAGKKLVRLNRKYKTYAAKVAAQADKLYVKNWTLSYSLPQIIQNCTNTTLCVQSDNSATISSYNDTARQLKALLDGVIKLLKRNRLSTSAVVKFTRSSTDAFAAALSTSASVPRTTSVCSGKK